MNELTLEEATSIRDEALECTDEESQSIAAVLTQLISHMQPKVIQMDVAGAGMNKITTVLKSDGTMWREKWNDGWEQLQTP